MVQCADDKWSQKQIDEWNLNELRFTKALIVDDAKAIDIENHRINFVVSSDVIDRSGESVVAEAVYKATQKAGEFRDNPVCLIAHRHHLNTDEPPSIGTWDTATAKLRRHHVEMVLQFDTELGLGGKYWTAYKNKTMRAVSIGFRIKDYHVEEQAGRRVLIITEIELIEISVCAVGMNQEALAKLKSLGLDVSNKEQSEDWVQRIADAVAAKMAARLDVIEETLDDLKTLALPGTEDDFSVFGLKTTPPSSDDPEPERISVSALKKAIETLTKK